MMLKLRDGVSAADTDYGIALLDEDSAEYWNLNPTAARLLATQSPRRIRIVLGWLRRGARPASFEQAMAARDTVVAVSLACASREGCVPRSLATVLLCRLRSQWPTWCVGARRLPPFA